MRKFRHISFTFFVTVSVAACGGGAGGGSSTPSSSHNAGLNCLSSACHSNGGGAIEFSAAGTIYNGSGGPQTNATVKFYVAGTNTLITQAATDASGNFYTRVDMSSHFSGNGVSPEVTGPSGGVSSMASAVSGQCNASGCHASNNRINAN